jgi:DNA repair photolyase
MVQYIKMDQAGPVLSSKMKEVNELFLASYRTGAYGGCEFGCAYCDGWAFSDIPLNSNVYIPVDRPVHLAREISAIPKSEVIGLSLSEPYQPVEKRYRITRRMLQVLAQAHRPVIIITKSPTVCEDISVLKEINQKTGAIVAITLVTLEPGLAKLLEAGAPLPEDRLETVVKLRQAGIACGIALIPILPYLTDQKAHLIRMFEKLKTVNPDFVVWDSLWIHQGRHLERINQLVNSYDGSLLDRYSQLYQGANRPSETYRQQLDQQMLAFCDDYGLAPRIPEHLYEKILSFEVVAKLRQKKHRFLNQIRVQ